MLRCSAAAADEPGVLSGSSCIDMYCMLQGDIFLRLLQTGGSPLPLSYDACA